jgi:tRNA A-37 threonylcarbamoyl transferase component Bud32
MITPPLKTICGYPVDSALSKASDQPSDSYLAIGPGGRAVVLKAMEDDCLLKGTARSAGGQSPGGLHPSIRERLSRVRELAHVGVANLYGVERDAGRAWMIWEFVPGQTFDEYASAVGRTPRELAAAARELALTVDSLHVQGIIHGAVKGGNVIVTPGGLVRLTHVSPYLWADPAEDGRAVLAMLEETLFARHEERSPLAKVLLAAQERIRELGESADGMQGVRILAAHLAAFLGSRDEHEQSEDAAPRRSRDAGPRRRSLAGAAVVTLLGAAAAYGAWHAAGKPPIQWPRGMPAAQER